MDRNDNKLPLANHKRLGGSISLIYTDEILNDANYAICLTNEIWSVNNWTFGYLVKPELSRKVLQFGRYSKRFQMKPVFFL